jgi:hypothetical protein
MLLASGEKGISCGGALSCLTPIARGVPKAYLVCSICAAAPQASTRDGLKKLFRPPPNLKLPTSSLKRKQIFAEGETTDLSYHGRACTTNFDFD